jgi:hypothetical protein
LDTDLNPRLADGDSLKGTLAGAVEGDEDEGLKEDDGGKDVDLEAELSYEKISMASKTSPDEDWVPHRQRRLKSHRKNKKCKST